MKNREKERRRRKKTYVVIAKGKKRASGIPNIT